MAVDALYLLDERRQIRRAIVWGVYVLIHDEASYELDAEINAAYGAQSGEFLGFYDIDRRFRLFAIDKAEADDARGVTVITATDAAIAQLAHSIVQEARMDAATARQAAQAVLDGSGFALGDAPEGGDSSELSVYMQTRWKALRDIAVQYQVRVTPYFDIEGGQIAARRVDVTPRTNVYRGRLIEGAGGAKLYVAHSGLPIGRMYGYGKATGEEDPPACVTFADVVWSRASGDPADKPAGQAHIDDPDADGADRWEDVYADKYEEDPARLLQKTWEALQKKRLPRVSGTATAADLEHLPGQEHKLVRLYDRVIVRTKGGEDAEAVVVGIKRNYLQRGQTRITVGEETDDSDLIKRVAQTASDVKSTESTAKSTSNRLIITRQLVQVNADLIQLNAREIQANAEKIDLTASNLKSFQEGTDQLLTQVRMDMYGDGTSANAGLIATVSDAQSELSRAAVTLYGDGTSANIGLVTKVGDNEAAIGLHADELGTLTQIKADKIDLQGYVTAKALESEFALFESSITDQLSVQKLSAVNLDCGTFRFADNSISLKSFNPMTGGKVTEGATMTNYPVLKDGVKIGSVNIPSTWKFSATYSTSKIYYLSWE